MAEHIHTRKTSFNIPEVFGNFLAVVGMEVVVNSGAAADVEIEGVEEHPVDERGAVHQMTEVEDFQKLRWEVEDHQIHHQSAADLLLPLLLVDAETVAVVDGSGILRDCCNYLGSCYCCDYFDSCSLVYYFLH